MSGTSAERKGNGRAWGLPYRDACCDGRLWHSFGGNGEPEAAWGSWGNHQNAERVWLRPAALPRDHLELGDLWVRRETREILERMGEM